MEFKPSGLSTAMFEDGDWLILAHDYVLLKNRRLELGLTQQQVADKAKIQLRQYQRVESGERHITGASGRIMLAICAVLKIDPYEFFPEFKQMWKE